MSDNLLDKAWSLMNTLLIGFLMAIGWLLGDR
jgi:hypothetical protein